MSVPPILRQGVTRARAGSVPDLAFAAFLLAVAAGTLHFGQALSLGRAADMGPGYVPRGLAILIALFGLGIGAGGLLAARRAWPAGRLRPLVLTLAALGVFALALPRAGFVIAASLTLGVASAAAPGARPLESLAFGIVLVAFCVVLFVSLLGLPLAVWPR